MSRLNLCFAIWGLVLVALAPVAPAGEPIDQRAADTLYYAAGLGVDKLNPMLKTHGWCEASCMIFNRLYRVSSTGQIEFDLLRSAKFSKDLLTLTLDLKQNVVWHDGAAFTAHDVAFTFDVLFDHKTPTDLDKDLTSMGSWKVDGQHRVVVTMKRPDPHIDGRLSEVPMLPRLILHGADLATAAFNDTPVGTGAFMFDRRESANVLWLRADPRYHEGAPAIKRVKLVTIADDEARAKAIARGELDFGNVKGQHLSLFDKLGPGAVRRYQSGAWRGMPINLRNPTYQDARVRQAIAKSIDRTPFVEIAARGLAKRASSPLVPGSPMGLRSCLPVEIRAQPGVARTLLDDAGWKTGLDGLRVKDGLRLALRLVVWKDEAFRRSAADILKRQLAGVGVEVELNLFDNAGYNRNASNMGESFDAFIGGWGGLADPVGNIYRKFHTNGSQNHMGYSNPRVDEMIEKAIAEPDARQSGTHLRFACVGAERDAVFIPLIYPEYAFAASRRIDNLPAGPVDSWYEITKHAYAWRIVDGER